MDEYMECPYCREEFEEEDIDGLINYDREPGMEYSDEGQDEVFEGECPCCNHKIKIVRHWIVTYGDTKLRSLEE